MDDYLATLGNLSATSSFVAVVALAVAECHPDPCHHQCHSTSSLRVFYELISAMFSNRHIVTTGKRGGDEI